MKKILPMLLIGFLPGAFSSLSAQEHKAPEGMAPSKPVFGPELARLSFLVGNFTSENIMYDSPIGKGGPGKGRNMNRWGLDSIFLMINYEGTMAVMGKYEGRGMMIYDRASQQYKCWWFDNHGKHSEYTGGFAGDTLMMETETRTPEGSFKEKIMWHPEGKKVKFRMVWDMGQGPMPVMEETATPNAGGARVRPKK